MSEWKEYKLGEVVNILDSKRIPLSSKERSARQGCYPYYGAQGIIDYIDDYIFDGTFLLIAEDGENLKSQKQNVAQLASGKYWVNNHAHILESNGKSDIRYICYLLNTLDLSGYITGSAQPKLNQANLVKIAFKLPPLEIQKDIADCLSVFDDKIEVNRKINENLEQQAQALFKSWFVDFVPFKNGRFVESELGLIPEGWKVGKLDQVTCNITDGVHNTVKDVANGGFYLLSCKNIKGGIITIGDHERTIDGETFNKLRKRTKLQKGDILLSSVGTIGEMVLLNDDLSNIEFQRSVAIIKPDNDVITSHFLFYSLMNQKVNIIHSAHGAVQQCLFISDIANFSTIIPPKEDIIKFTNVVKVLVDKKTTIEKENKCLASLRDTLLPKLMSGEISLE